MQIITFIYINLFVFAVIFAAVKTLDIFTENIYAGFYLSDEIVINTLPIIKLLVLGKYIGSIDVWAFIIADVVIVMVSLALYKHRKTENAGTPIAFKGFEKIFRYSMIFLVTMLVGIFFETLMGNIAWLVFGLVIGSVLSFMLLNAVLLKNIRKMFNGIKPFAICLVIITLVYVCLGFDVLGIDEYIPDEKNIKSVTVYEMNNLEKMHENINGSIIIISHQERILNIADKIFVIAGGKVEKSGTREEILPEMMNVSGACKILTDKTV